MNAPIPPFPVAALAGIWLAGQRAGGDERTEHEMSDEAAHLIAEVIGSHRLEKSARFTPMERTEWWTCLGCDWESEEFDLDDSEVGREIERVKRIHLGEAVASALGGLTRESHTYTHCEHQPVVGGQMSRYVGQRTQERWVGSWTAATSEGADHA